MISVKSIKTYFGTNAERVAAGLNAFLQGDEFVETDTEETYQHNGMTWVKTSISGAYLEIANNLSDLNNAATARANLGLVSGGAGDIWVEKAGDVMTGPLTVGLLLDVQSTGIIFNDGEDDIDLRIAGDGLTNGVYWDAGNGRFGIRTIPSAALHVVETSGTAAIFEESASGEVGINSFYNPNTTDANGAIIRFDTNTTGTGATSRSQIAQIGVVFTTHNHATRTGNIVFRNYQSGAFSTRMTIGAGVTVGAPTGGDKGAGTINATAVYDDNTLLTDYVFEPDYPLLTIDAMMAFYEINKHLPTIPGRKEWEKNGKFSLGKLANYLWETVEVQAIYISQLHKRLGKLEHGN